MPVDTSMYSTLRAPQIESPLQAMQTASAAQDAQLKGLAVRDQLATRQALQQNTAVDQSGNMQFNRQGALSQLAQTSPMAAMQLGQQFRQMDLQKLQQEHAIGQQLIATMPQGANVSDDDKKAAWQQIVQRGDQLGLNYSQHFGTAYPGDDKFQQIKNASLDLGQQIAQANKDVEHNLQQQDLDVKRQQFMYGKQQDALQQVTQSLNSSRQLPNVKQAYLDRYNGQKFLDLIHMNGDPDKLFPQGVSTAMLEVGKIASGIAPTEEEFKAMAPKDAKLIQANASQYLKGHPEAGQQGAFLHEYEKYITGIMTNANNVINKNVGRTIDNHKRWLNPNDYQNLTETWVKGNPLVGDPGQQAGPGGAQKPAGAPAAAGGGMVGVIAPNGRIKMIPQNMVNAALANGGRLAGQNGGNVAQGGQ